ncbi:unnamed protein product [Malus baccata var. baccata]
MEKLFGEQWRSLGIYDAILLSSMDVVLDNELLLAALCFWCSATNTMVLPLGPIGPTILDVNTILGTSAARIPIDAALFGYPSNLDLKMLFDRRAFETLSSEGQKPSKEDVHKLHKNFFNYNTLYLHFADRGDEALREGEHEAFPFYWYNKISFLHQATYIYVGHGRRGRPSSILGVFVLTHDLSFGCDGKRAGWEVYHPNFLARQLGYLQGCPVPLLSSRTVLSRGQCQRFCLQPATPETLCTDTFGEWWEKYTQEFFGAPVEDVLNKLFGGRPKKAFAPQAQGSRPLKKVEVVAAAATEKKLVVAKRVKTAGRAVSSKRPRQEAEPAIEPPPLAKRVKKLAKKGAREIHVISSQTTGATTPSVSPSPAVGQPLVEKPPAPAAETVQTRPVSGAGTPVMPPSVEKAPVPKKAVSCWKCALKPIM